MNRFFLIAGSLFAVIAVMLGAFGAHALKAKLSAEQLQTFETGVRYQFYHAFALMILFSISGKIGSTYLNFSGTLFIAGIILFSGSLYLLASNELLGLHGIKGILGPITPFGGLCFIAGWICLLVAAVKFNG